MLFFFGKAPICETFQVECSNIITEFLMALYFFRSNKTRMIATDCKWLQVLAGKKIQCNKIKLILTNWNLKWLIVSVLWPIATFVDMEWANNITQFSPQQKRPKKNN